MRRFARASMVDLIVRYLQRTYPDRRLPESTRLDALRQATIRARIKRDLLSEVWTLLGAGDLLSIGQGIRELTYDPVWFAALRSSSPQILLEKWRRFEAFAHSHNRVLICHEGAQAIRFDRTTVDGGMPTPAENLFICGLVIALLEAIGCRDLRCCMPLRDGPEHLLRAGGRFLLPAGLSTEARSAAEQVLGLLQSDVSHQWTICQVAAATGCSRRSLQRRLAEASLSFSRLTRIVRIHAACAHLADSSAAITSIGFTTGFSDGAHFSREFRASVGMSPSDFRRLCAAYPEQASEAIPAVAEVNRHAG